MPSAVLKDRWLTVALVLTASVYIGLLLIRPSGENWGRGWNMIAFLIYAAPTAVASGLVAWWRRGKTAGSARRVAGWVAVAALVFPVVCIVGIRMKA